MAMTPEALFERILPGWRAAAGPIIGLDFFDRFVREKRPQLIAMIRAEMDEKRRRAQARKPASPPPVGTTAATQPSSADEAPAPRKPTSLELLGQFKAHVLPMALAESAVINAIKAGRYVEIEVPLAIRRVSTKIFMADMEKFTALYKALMDDRDFFMQAEVMALRAAEEEAHLVRSMPETAVPIASIASQPQASTPTPAAALSKADREKIIERAKKLGDEAFHRGIGSAPALNQELSKLYRRWGQNVGTDADHKLNMAIMSAYTDAWTKANLAEPVPGLEDLKPTRFSPADTTDPNVRPLTDLTDTMMSRLAPPPQAEKTRSSTPIADLGIKPLSKELTDIMDTLTEGLANPSGEGESSRRYDRTPGGAYMAAVIERIGDKRYSVAHYFRQNGDSVADPDLEFIKEKGLWYPVAVTQVPVSNRGGYTEAIVWREDGKYNVDRRAYSGLVDLARVLLRNIVEQQEIEIQRGSKRESSPTPLTPPTLVEQVVQEPTSGGPPPDSPLADFEWRPTTRERHEQRLNVLPPAAEKSSGFLLGEPMDHDATGRPRYLAHRRYGNDYFEGSRPVTRTEFEVVMTPYVAPKKAGISADLIKIYRVPADQGLPFFAHLTKTLSNHDFKRVARIARGFKGRYLGRMLGLGAGFEFSSENSARSFAANVNQNHAVLTAIIEPVPPPAPRPAAVATTSGEKKVPPGWTDDPAVLARIRGLAEKGVPPRWASKINYLMKTIGQRGSVPTNLIYGGPLEEVLANTEEAIAKALAKQPKAVQLQAGGGERGAVDEDETRAAGNVVMLAGMDPDKAKDKNDVGFQKSDVATGHAIARRWETHRKLTDLEWQWVKDANQKYRRQLGIKPAKAQKEPKPAKEKKLTEEEIIDQLAKALAKFEYNEQAEFLKAGIPWEVGTDHLGKFYTRTKQGKYKRTWNTEKEAATHLLKLVGKKNGPDLVKTIFPGFRLAVGLDADVQAENPASPELYESARQKLRDIGPTPDRMDYFGDYIDRIEKAGTTYQIGPILRQAAHNALSAMDISASAEIGYHTKIDAISGYDEAGRQAMVDVIAEARLKRRPNDFDVATSGGKIVEEVDEPQEEIAVPLHQQDNKSIVVLERAIRILSERMIVDRIRSGHGYRVVMLKNKESTTVFSGLPPGTPIVELALWHPPTDSANPDWNPMKRALRELGRPPDQYFAARRVVTEWVDEALAKARGEASRPIDHSTAVTRRLLAIAAPLRVFGSMYNRNVDESASWVESAVRGSGGGLDQAIEELQVRLYAAGLHHAINENVIQLPDGRIFPVYKGEALSWDPDGYNTKNEEDEGYPRARAVLEAIRNWRPGYYARLRSDFLKSSSDRMFGHNAKPMLRLVEEIEKEATEALPTPEHIVTLGALAGSRKSKAAELSHSVILDARENPVRALCNRVQPDNIADIYSADDLDAPPSCTVCLGKDPRFKREALPTKACGCKQRKAESLPSKQSWRRTTPLTAEEEAELQAEVDAWMIEQDEREAKFAAFVEKPRELYGAMKEGGHMLVHRDSTEPGSWRATRLDDEGVPFGHMGPAPFADVMKYAQGDADIYALKPISKQGIVETLPRKTSDYIRKLAEKPCGCKHVQEVVIHPPLDGDDHWSIWWEADGAKVLGDDAMWKKAGRVGNGHDWTDLFRRRLLQREGFDAVQPITWDPESSALIVTADSKAPLMKLAKVMREVLASKESLVQEIAGLPRSRGEALPNRTSKSPFSTAGLRQHLLEAAGAARDAFYEGEDEPPANHDHAILLLPKKFTAAVVQAAQPAALHLTIEPWGGGKRAFKLRPEELHSEGQARSRMVEALVASLRANGYKAEIIG